MEAGGYKTGASHMIHQFISLVCHHSGFTDTVGNITSSNMNKQIFETKYESLESIDYLLWSDPNLGSFRVSVSIQIHTMW